MKLTYLLVCISAISALKRIEGSAIRAPLDVITLDDVSPEERRHLEYLNHHYPRPKRSGSDLIGYLKEKISQGIKSKLSSIARSSAGAIGSLSSASSSSQKYHYHHYDLPETYEHKSSDFWGLKKAILNTLLQAVKAIKGGVIAMNGYLIKGSGHLITAKGKLLSAKGEAITNLGKEIATAAAAGTSLHDHEDYTHYSHGPEEAPEYVPPPSGPDTHYGSPDNFHSIHHEHDDKFPTDGHAGLLILKKIQSTGRGHDSKPPEFKPLPPKEPSWGTIIGKFFKASTSFKPDEPALFGDYAPAPTHADYHEAAKPAPEFGEHYEEAPAFADGLPSESRKKPKTVSKEPTEVLKPAASNHIVTNPNDLPSIDDFGPYPGPLPADFAAKYGLPTAYTLGGSFLPTPFDEPAKAPGPIPYDVVRSVAYEIGADGPKRL